ncbi:MAG: MBL fold metallo-hydrolase, partial [Myxococcota bacterium]|nr:MBL fold metallo-hydrolase [Myxococcota bacterium]
VVNGSRDAAGGLGNLDRWLDTSVPLCVPGDLWDELVQRYGPFENLEHLPLKVGTPQTVGDLDVTAFALPTQEGKSPRPNYGYHFQTGKKSVTYASDMKTLPEDAAPYFEDNDLLVVDAAGWDKDLPNHRGALNHLQSYVEGRNARIIFTDVGRSAPPHSQASSMVRRMCAGADVGFDFMKVPLGR